MNTAKTIVGYVLALVVVMLGVVIFYENHTFKKRQLKVEEDAELISAYVWALDKEAVIAYEDMRLDRGYGEALRINHLDGSLFVSSEAHHKRGLIESVLHSMSLIRCVENKAVIRNEGKPIGVLIFTTKNENFYSYLVLFIVVSSVLVAVYLLRYTANIRRRRLLTEEELVLYQKRLNAVVSAAPVIALSMNTLGEIVICEGRGLDHLGVDGKDMVGMPVTDLYEGVENDFLAALAGETVRSIHKIKGNMYEVWFSPQGDDDVVEGVCGVFTDVTELMAALVKLADSERAMKEELLLAHQIHEMLNPIKAPRLDGYDFGLLYVPCNQLGGDFLRIDNGNANNLDITFTDITGHGVGAALLSTMFKTMLCEAISSNQDIESAFYQLNRNVHDQFPSGFFASTFHAQIDIGSGSMRYVKAAQDPVYILRKGQVLYEITGGGPALGIMPNELIPEGKFTEHQVDLHHGDLVLMFTDGLSEIENDHQEELGRDRIVKWVGKIYQLDAQEIVELIYQKAMGFAGGRELGDDVTALVIKVSEPKGSLLQ